MLEIEIEEDIRLERLNHTHAQGIFNLINSNREYLRKWLTFVDSTRNLKDTEDYISYIEKSSANPNSEVVIAILIKDNLMGIMGIKKVDWANRIAEIGYWLGEEYQGRGIITKSCRAILDYAFGQMGVNRVEIKCGVGNERSCHVPQRLGFTFEGIERDGELVNGQYIDLEVYSLLRREWHAIGSFAIKKQSEKENDKYKNLKVRASLTKPY
ncbi:MAG TPA: GNAT family protein [Bacteroidales bacterium]